MLRALFYAYVLGGLTFIPLLIAAFVFITIYTSVPVGDADITKKKRAHLEALGVEGEEEKPEEAADKPEIETNDLPKARKGWLTMRRTFEETAGDGSYVTLMRSFLDSRSKDPKRSRPKDMWYVALKGKVLYLYEDEEMSECEAAVELSSHQVLIYPEDLPDGELFAKRNAICLRPKSATSGLPSLTKEMKFSSDSRPDTPNSTSSKRESALEAEKKREASRQEAMDTSTPWYIFVKSNIEMEDWYFALLHASEHPAQTPTLLPLRAVFEPTDMNHLVSTLDEQPDVIPMRWLNALIGRIFFSHYRTHNLEAYIIGRLMKKLAKIKRPAFLTEIAVTEVSVGNRAPMLSKPMLKELTKEGDASLEVHLQYKGEIRLTVEATVVINLGARFKSYTVKVVLAVVLKEIEGNLLIKVKRPPSNRIWYAFTQTPRMVLEVEPIVSDRQLTWGMILSTIESKLKEVIQESVVMPNMDDIAFFESSDYEHRGGIWSDACRKPHVPSAAADIPADAQSTVSAPPELVPTVSPEPEPQPSMPPPNVASTTPSPPFLDETVSLPASVEDSRRKSWFSSMRSDDSSATAPIPTFHKTNASEDQRGRTMEQDKPSPRSQSTRSQPDLSRPLSLEQAGSSSDTNDSLIDTFLRPSSSSSSSTRRSASQHSIKLDYDPNDIDMSDSDSRPKSNPATPRKNSDAAPMARSASPPSFFSTLKSKAADKQAVSNAAKEAMRKWGVNWGGFKKDNKEDDASSSGSPPKGGQANENSIAHKARASYAEVRAAVAERKEREKGHVEEGADLLTPTPFTAARQRAASGSSSIFSSSSIYSDTASNPSVVSATSRLAPKLNNKKSTPSLSRVHTEMDPQDLAVEEAVKPAPIHVQPQAKTMSIPGIHASHKGEVQSMGYVAPQPPPTNPAEAMLKNPAIQKVYQLWKTPSAGSNASESETKPHDETSKESHTANEVERSSSLASTSNHQTVTITPLPPAALKPTPPPLPPRSSSSTSPRSVPALPSDSPPSLASQALKDIVTRDERIQAQASVDSETSSSDVVEASAGSDPEAATTPPNGDSDSPPVDYLAPSKTPPALPPRRISTPA
ncbi:hypothetical protein CVT24_008654 [Panaeolus cyanescens]|uniref:SMP-LTD domain-containing protein n=1 Tax=Panaeolus cyanescens TaxID=181874 RepID=A0A409VBA9_9AGAR|nr:hypothetical protein CVT24_008654 [Panaeolus cyanescens]